MVFCLKAEETFNLIRLESSLTHASYIVYYAVTAYALTAQYLIRHPRQTNRHQLAVNYAQQFLADKKLEWNTKGEANSKYIKKLWIQHRVAIEEVDNWIDKAKSVAQYCLDEKKKIWNRTQNKIPLHYPLVKIHPNWILLKAVVHTL